MEKNIWVYCKNKTELIKMQQMINATGGVRACCMLSVEAARKMINKDDRRGMEHSGVHPSLFLVDFESAKEDGFEVMSILCQHNGYEGVPLAVTINEHDEDNDRLCYEMGATLLLMKPVTKMSVLRMERLAWQHEKTKNYERLLQKQAYELLVAREIRELNQMLESRNALLRQVFGRYFSNEITEHILANPDGARVGGEKREVTVMMADLRGFTAISETVPADVITEVINYFLGKMTEVIFQFNGSVIEFIGDAILAVFGAPEETANSNEDAVAAAINMQNAMSEVNAHNKNMGYPRIEMGIGLHRGEVFIGNIGSEHMMRYNVIGSTVNLCSRIENCSVGGQILISESMAEEIREKGVAELEILDRTGIVVKGFSKQVNICDVAGIHGIYEYGLTKIADEECFPLKEEIPIEVFRMYEKEIARTSLPAVMKGMSTTCALIQLQEDTRFQVYDEVELLPMHMKDSVVFAGKFAKIVWKRGKQMMLRFISGRT